MPPRLFENNRRRSAAEAAVVCATIGGAPYLRRHLLQPAEDQPQPNARGSKRRHQARAASGYLRQRRTEAVPARRRGIHFGFHVFGSHQPNIATTRQAINVNIWPPM